MKRVRYIGRKPLKADTVARTGLTWTPGQVRDVDDAPAARLLGYPSVWVEDVGAMAPVLEIAPKRGLRKIA
jgi:hypothetical protein